jgi:hypothetical protein
MKLVSLEVEVLVDASPAHQHLLWMLQKHPIVQASQVALTLVAVTLLPLLEHMLVEFLLGFTLWNLFRLGVHTGSLLL